jgi:hypothetical protein
VLGPQVMLGRAPKPPRRVRVLPCSLRVIMLALVLVAVTTPPSPLPSRSAIVAAPLLGLARL